MSSLEPVPMRVSDADRNGTLRRLHNAVALGLLVAAPALAQQPPAIPPANGTDTFDNGSVNIYYE